MDFVHELRSIQNALAAEKSEKVTLRRELASLCSEVAGLKAAFADLGDTIRGDIEDALALLMPDDEPNTPMPTRAKAKREEDGTITIEIEG